MLDADEQKVLDDIAEHGWHVVAIKKDRYGPGFTYTIGLMETWRHPEVILFGLDTKTMYDMLAVLVNDVREGADYRESGSYGDILEGFDCFTLPVHPSRHAEYLGYAMWHRRHVGKAGTLEAIQLFWPDRKGRFPWEHACDLRVTARQPGLQGN